MTPAAQLDRRAVLAGALAAATVALPAALLAEVVVEGASAGSALLFALVLLGFAFGGFTAARAAGDRSPLSHGAVAALLAYLAIQAIGVVRRLVVDDPVRPAGIVFAALLASLSGLLGAALASRAPR